MNMKKNNHEGPEQAGENESGSSRSADQTFSKRGAEAYEQAEEAASNAYDKTSEKVSNTYERVKRYSSENPGKSILVALGIGVGIGLILGSSTRRRPGVTSRLARPVVHALSDIALDFWR